MKIKLFFFLYISLSCLVVTDLDGIHRRNKTRKQSNTTNSNQQHRRVLENPNALSDEALEKLLKSGTFNTIPENKQKKSKNDNQAPIITSDVMSDEELNTLLTNGAFDLHEGNKTEKLSISGNKQNKSLVPLPKKPPLPLPKKQSLPSTKKQPLPFPKKSPIKTNLLNGLKNFGASCYFNSVIQCFAQSEILLPALLHAQENYLTQKNIKKFSVQTDLDGIHRRNKTRKQSNTTNSNQQHRRVLENPNALSDEALEKLLKSGAFNTIPENKQKKSKNDNQAPIITSDVMSDEELNTLLTNGAFDLHEGNKTEKLSISEKKQNKSLVPLPKKQSLLSTKKQPLPFPKKSPIKKNLLNGLKNFGASCYFNSVIQCFAQSGILLPALLHAQENYLTQKNIKKFTIQKELIQLLITMQHNTQTKVIDPSTLYNLVIKNRFDNNRGQQCAYECFGFLIEQLTNPAFDRDKVFQNIFQCNINKETRCINHNCNRLGNKIDPYTIFDLPIDQNKTSSLQKVLENFFNNETTLDWKCNQCGNKGSSNTYRFTQSPELLIVNLKRYKFTQTKNKKGSVLAPVKIKTAVSFPLNGLNISKYCAPNNQDAPVVYDLIGTVMHSGEAHGGHYTSMVKNIGDNCWIYCNDSVVEKKQNSVIENIAKTGLFNESTPSILIYQKKA